MYKHSTLYTEIFSLSLLLIQWLDVTLMYKRALDKTHLINSAPFFPIINEINNGDEKKFQIDTNL